MDKVLYQDNKFELAYNEKGMYLDINGERYILSCHPYNPSTYIKSQDGTVNIEASAGFDLSFVVQDFENGQNTYHWRYKEISPLRFCEMMELDILKNKEEGER